MARSVLKPHATVFLGILRLADPALPAIVGLIAYGVHPSIWPMPEQYLLFIGAGAVTISAVFPLFRLYDPQRGVSLTEELRRLVLAWAVLAALAGSAIFATKMGDAFSRIWVSTWLGGGLVATVATRVSVRLVLRRLRERGHNLRHIAIVGAGTLGRTIAERLQSAPWAGLHVVAFYDDDPAKEGTFVAGTKVAGSADRVAEDVRRGGIDQVWIALPLRADLRIRAVLAALQTETVEVRFVPDIYNFTLLHHSMTEIAGLAVINLTDSPLHGVNALAKALEDLLLAAMFLVLASPVMLAIAIGVKRSSPGPVFYRQERVTWNGERFSMLKFRTMPAGVEAESGPVWANPAQQRATPFGAFLRRWSLDELPQFINVLRGDMSIVGPRPERPEFVMRFKEEIPGYMQKHLVKAGITGWAQVNDFRGDTDLRARIQYDLYYIENWSVWFDLRIIAMTIGHVIKSRNAY
ncbi:MAG: undecaprenyl-phosphate glucose phosphotransferase [Betaproteobacteria bacterium]|jgi:putative colanic acid biosynthesis UDP-glucose lipid carrier transferase|nr:undecaprenyl-phosphate glucose phosphotransferase [Betaproteobacteria bacterium]